MAKNIRNISGHGVQDPSIIDALQHSEASGSKKVSEVGRSLLPIPFISAGAVAYTTDGTTARVLPKKGANLAVYNNAGAVGAVTLGGSAAEVATALAAGVTDASGHVGIPCMPNAWTYIACAGNQWLKSTAATLLIFIIDDETHIKQEVS